MVKAQVILLRRLLRAFVGRGLLESFEAKEMRAYQHSEPTGDKCGVNVDELALTPPDLIERIAALALAASAH